MTIKVTPEYLAELRRLADFSKRANKPASENFDQLLHDCANAIPALLDHIEKLEAANRWIPATERLPDRDRRVLIVVEYSHEKGFTSSDAGYLSSSGEWYYAEDDEHEIFHKDVTHWRELPAPPQEIK